MYYSNIAAVVCYFHVSAISLSLLTTFSSSYHISSVSSTYTPLKLNVVVVVVGQSPLQSHTHNTLSHTQSISILLPVTSKGEKLVALPVEGENSERKREQIVAKAFCAGGDAPLRM